MCEPATIMMAISAATAASGLAAQQSQADYQSEANARQAANALQNRADNANQVGLSQIQQHNLASQKINENNTAMREAQSSVVASAGPSGLSVDALLSNLATRGAKYNSSVEENLASTNMALDNQMRNVNANATNTINALKTPVAPDYLGTALRIGGQAYSSGLFGGTQASTNNNDSRPNRAGG